MDVSVSKTIDQKMYLKKFGGDSALLAPPGSAYGSPMFLKLRAISCVPINAKGY